MLGFPHDLVIDIFRRQPVKTLLRFKCISKPICSLIDDPDFIKSHLNHSLETNSNRSLIFSNAIMRFSDIDFVLQVDLDSLDNSVKLDHPFNDCEHPSAVIGSCNGLLAIEKYDMGIALWNPSTKKHKMLPDVWSPIDSRMEFYYNCGFGYDAASDDYKLVRLRRYKESRDTEVFVYSLKANSWKKLEDTWYTCLCRPGEIAAVVDGALHWTSEDRWIVAFDLDTETFFEVPSPDITGMWFTYVGVLGGCLSWRCDQDGCYRVDVWVMKEYWVMESWTKLFSIQRERESEWWITEHGPEEECSTSIWVMKDHEVEESRTKLVSLPQELKSFGAYDVIVLAQSGNKVLFCVREQFVLLGEHFYWYDLDKEILEAVEINDLPEDYWYVVTSVASLVSLDAT